MTSLTTPKELAATIAAAVALAYTQLSASGRTELCQTLRELSGHIRANNPTTAASLRRIAKEL